jgi:hypothetical protein
MGTVVTQLPIEGLPAGTVHWKGGAGMPEELLIVPEVLIEPEVLIVPELTVCPPCPVVWVLPPVPAVVVPPLLEHPAHTVRRLPRPTLKNNRPFFMFSLSMADSEPS